MQKIYEKIKKQSTWKSILLFLVLFLITYIVISGKPFGVAQLKEYTNGVGILDLERGYSPEYAYEIFKLQGDVGRQFYTKILVIFDVIFPLAYMLFFSTIMTFIFSRWLPDEHVLQKLSLLPILAGIFDYFENTFILIMLHNYPKELFNIAAIANIMTILKGVVFTISILLLVVGLFGLLFVKNKKMKSKNI